MTNDEQQDRIDDYLLGRAPGQRDAFERDLAQDEDLRRRLEETELARQAIEIGEDDRLKARLREVEKTFTSSPAAPPQSKEARLRPLRRYLALAAALLLLLTAGWFLLDRQEAPEDLFALADFTPYPNIAYSITKGENEDAEAAAYVAYENGDYETAIVEFTLLPGTQGQRFYLGQSLLATERFAQATEVFLPLATDRSFNLRQESEYYLALARLGTGATQVALDRLSAIAQTAGHPMAAEANALLLRLGNG